MTVIVIGLGSMGKRRIRLIKAYDASITIIGIDLSAERVKAVSAEFGIITSSDLDMAIDKHQPMAAFVCTAPLSHSKIITQCLNRNLHIFTELNLVADSYTHNIKLAKDKMKVLFLSSTLQYRQEIKRVKQQVGRLATACSYVYHIGQYLPDWHPWENYKDFFVGDKKTSGCREIFAIELPWLVNVFGEVIDFSVKKSKISNLDIDYYDTYHVLVEHKSGHIGSLVVDVVARQAVRNLEVVGERLHLVWDGSPNGLKVYDINQQQFITQKLYKDAQQSDDYSAFIVENAYQDEITHFFDIIVGRCSPFYSFDDDQKILRLIDRIEA